MGRFDVQLKQRPHLHERLAPARAREVRVGAAAADRQRDLLRSAELLGQPAQLGSHVQQHAAEPHVDGIPEPQRGYGSVNQSFVDDFPKIAGVAGYNVPPQMSFSDGFAQFGQRRRQHRQRHDAADVHHQRLADVDERRAHRSRAGWNTGRSWETSTATATRPAASRSGVAPRPAWRQQRQPDRQFPLGAVDSANATFRAVDSAYPRQNAWILFAGDTWRATNQLTIDYGLRWDYYSPSSEQNTTASRSSIRRERIRGRRTAGRLAFAGDGSARPATVPAIRKRISTAGLPRASGWSTGPMTRRVPAADGASSTCRRSIRAGAEASRRTGSRPPRRSIPASAASSRHFPRAGFPQTFEQPPIIDSAYRNGQDLLYRPVDANKRPYSHQWNITVDRELGRNVSLSVGYVGSAGRRLPSSIDPLNAIDPQHLAMGEALYDEFTPDMTSLHGVPCHIRGGPDQMTGCAPSVAQALRPFPQHSQQPAGPEREPRVVALQLAAGEAGEAVLRRGLRAGVGHPCRKRSRVRPTTRSGMPSPGAVCRA